MATLVLTVAASTDDARISDLGYDETETVMQVGGTGSSAANHGQGWRFPGATLVAADTVTSAVLSLMKSSTQFSTRDIRLVVEDADNAAAFSSGSPPGSRAIVAGTIPSESPGTNELDGTRYDIPAGSTEQGQLGTLIDAVKNRGGWASGNAIAVVNNSDQDASAFTGFGRKMFHTWDSSTSSSEPTLTITYTPGASTLEQARYRFRNDDGSQTTATWKAAQNTGITEGVSITTRLRVQVQAVNDPTAKAFKLQFRRSGTSDWKDV